MFSFSSLWLNFTGGVAMLFAIYHQVWSVGSSIVGQGRLSLETFNDYLVGCAYMVFLGGVTFADRALVDFGAFVLWTKFKMVWSHWTSRQSASKWATIFKSITTYRQSKPIVYLLFWWNKVGQEAQQTSVEASIKNQVTTLLTQACSPTSQRSSSHHSWEIHESIFLLASFTLAFLGCTSS